MFKYHVTGPQHGVGMREQHGFTEKQLNIGGPGWPKLVSRRRIDRTIGLGLHVLWRQNEAFEDILKESKLRAPFDRRRSTS
jgi:hypothetical protein